MLPKLLSRVHVRFIVVSAFVVLFIGMTNVRSQTILLPGDLVIVSANATNHSFDFTPLVPIEKGTSVWFSNGTWDTSSGSLSEGQKVEVKFLASVGAGSNIHINSISDPRIEISDHIQFNTTGNRVFAYQKDETVLRFIFGVEWGNLDGNKSDSNIGYAIPTNLTTEEQTYIKLGLANNYQYHLKNGASGTSKMLLSFISDAAKWVGRDKLPYPSFGTTFRLLSPPVVLFDESVSTSQEGESIYLNVAIYEHDGSRLTVDAIFNESYSTIDSTDINKFKTHSFNFTGLIGNAVYSKEIEINDDRRYEYSETGFFELENLSKGQFGDFISHAAFIQDNDLPNVMLSEVLYTGNPDVDYIGIRNNERQKVDVSSWKIHQEEFIYEFEDGYEIEALSQIKIYPPSKRTQQKDGDVWLNGSSQNLILLDHKENQVSEIVFNSNTRSEKMAKNDVINERTVVADQPQISLTGSQTIKTKEIAEELIKSPGWYVVSSSDLNEDIFLDTPVFSWDETSQRFKSILDQDQTTSSNKVMFAFFDEEKLGLLNAKYDTTSITLEIIPYDRLEFEMSATDFDQNGIINGAEGYNLITNTSDISIYVNDLIELLETELFTGALYPNVYQWDNSAMGWKSATALSGFDLIAPNSTFWVKADSVFENTSISINVPQFIEKEPLLDEIFMDSYFSISLEGANQSDRLMINILEEEDGINRDLIAPELESGLQLDKSDFLFFGAKKGLNWNKEISLAILEDQKIVIPLAFATTVSGEYRLTVEGLNSLPSNIDLSITDLFTEKEYDIRQNQVVTFDHLVSNIEEIEEDPFVLSIGNEIISNRFTLSIIPPGVAEEDDFEPEQVRLNQNYPNPFNPRTTITFYLPEAADVKLSIFNVVGQPILVLVEGALGVGDHEYEWDASELPSGMYIYQLEVGNKITTQKMTLVK